MAKKLGDMLLQEGMISPAQLESALKEQQASQGFLGEILVRQGALTEDRLVDVLARQPGVARVDLASVTLDPSLASKIPEDMARKRGCIPIQMTGNMLQVGMLDPLDDRTIDFLGQHTGNVIKAAAVAPSALAAAYKMLYDGRGGGKAGKSGAAEPESEVKLPSGEEMNKLVERSIQEIADADIGKEDESEAGDATPLEIDPKDPPIIRLSNTLLIKCIELDASDIHLEPQETHVRVRYRIDGSLHEIFSLPNSIRPALTSRFKIMSEMDVAEHRIPQDGRIRLALSKGNNIDYRINTLPGVYGEKLVLRILGTGMLKGRVADLGFDTDDLESVENALKSHFGMVLVTGPTGSGKTTTL